MLSALIELAQFLVAHRAVVGVDEGEADFPSELLDRMQDRFMVYGSRSPIEWAHKLRAYGRGIQDRKTVQGFIVWSDDNETVSPKASELHLHKLEERQLSKLNARLLNIFRRSEPSQDPIEPLQNSKSKQTYIRTLQRLFCYFSRVTSQQYL